MTNVDKLFSDVMTNFRVWDGVKKAPGFPQVQKNKKP